MLFLMIIEGPIATMVAAFLASLGLFNIYVVLLLSILGDIIGDILLYALGFFGGHPLLVKAEKFLKIKQSVIDKIKKKFKEKGSQIIFSVKTTTGLCWIAFILAGTVRMSFQKFVLFSFLGGILWSGLLVALGYFFGYAAEQIEQYIKFAGWAIFSCAVLIVLYISTRKRQDI